MQLVLNKLHQAAYYFTAKLKRKTGFVQEVVTEPPDNITDDIVYKRDTLFDIIKTNKKFKERRRYYILQKNVTKEILARDQTRNKL